MDRTEITGLKRTTAWSKTVSSAIAMLLLAAGGLGLAGWVLDLERLYRPFAGSDPLRPVAAACLMLLGGSLASLARGRSRLARTLALIPVVLGLIALLVPSAILKMATPWDVPGGIWPAIASSLGIVLAGTAIIVMELRSGEVPRVFIVGTIGVTLIALNLAVLFVMLLGVNSGEQSSRLVGASLPTAVTLFLLGAHLAHEAWSAGWSPGAVPLWIPVGMGLASLTAVVFLWLALVAAQRDEGQALMRAAARSSRLATTEKFDAVRSALWRVALVTTRRRLSPATWAQYVDGIVRDLSGLEAIIWIPAGQAPTRVVSRTPEANAQVGILVERLRDRLEANPRAAPAEPGLEDSVRAFPLRGANLFFAAALPHCDETACDGFIVGILRPDSLLREVLGDTLYGYHRALSWEGRPLVISGDYPDEARQWTDSSEVRFGGLDWDLKVWPTADLLRRVQSDLPQAVLVLGLLLSCLLPATAQLARTLVSQGRTAEEARLALVLGRSMDRTWSWEVPRMPGTTPLLRPTGPTHEARVGPWTLLVHPDDRRRVESILSAHLSGRLAVFESEYRVADGNGGWHSRVDRGRVTERGPYGMPLQMVGVSGDVTERRRADEERDASERRFRAVFDSTAQFQGLLDTDCRILETNLSALRFLGHPLAAEELRGLEFWDTPWWPAEGTRARLRHACAEANGGRIFREEIQMEDRDGRVVYLDFSVRPIMDGEGRVIQLLAEWQDISGRRRAEEELRAVETLTTMGRIAARVAHEINNPLAGIQNSFLLIRDAIPEDHPHFSFVGAIQREIARIGSVTRQLYETYRPESEGSGRAGVRVLISDAVSLLEQVNRQSRVRIVAELGNCPNAVALPESVLRQSVYNLVQNAVEASPPDGVVTVRAGVDGGHFVLRVSDQGHGIPPVMRQRIFDPFVSTKDRSTPTGGMGIGLSLVRRSVEALGGTISIDSPEGRGAEFVVRIPLNPKNSGATT